LQITNSFAEIRISFSVTRKWEIKKKKISNESCTRSFFLQDHSCLSSDADGFGGGAEGLRHFLVQSEKARIVCGDFIFKNAMGCVRRFPRKGVGISELQIQDGSPGEVLSSQGVFMQCQGGLGCKEDLCNTIFFQFLNRVELLEI